MVKNAENKMKSLTDLEDFQGWESLSDEGDFFKETEKASKEKSTETKDVLNNVEKDEEGTEAKTEIEKDDKNESKKDDLFSSENPIENEENGGEEEESKAGIEGEGKGDEEEDKTKTPTTPNIVAANLLKEKGLIDFEIEDDKELTEEEAGELLEDKYDEAIEKRIGELFEDLPDVVKQLNKYALDGGDVSKFFGTLTKSSSSKISDNMDLDDENNQELVVREMLKAEDNDDEYIETQLEFLKDSGKLGMFAQKEYNKWKKVKAEQQKKLLDKQRDEREKERKAIKQAKQETSSFLADNDEIGELQFSKSDKKTLPTYMNDKTIKLQNGMNISQMQKELFYDLPQNKKALMQLATLMKNRNKDGTFNFKSIIKNTETKVANKVKENVRRSKQSIPTKSKIKNSTPKRSLADFFN